MQSSNASKGFINSGFRRLPDHFTGKYRLVQLDIYDQQGHATHSVSCIKTVLSLVNCDISKPQNCGCGVMLS